MFLPLWDIVLLIYFYHKYPMKQGSGYYVAVRLTSDRNLYLIFYLIQITPSFDAPH